MQPAFITPDGQVLSDNKDNTPSPEVEETPMELWKVAAKEAERQSTKKHQQGKDDV